MVEILLFFILVQTICLSVFFKKKTAANVNYWLLGLELTLLVGLRHFSVGEDSERNLLLFRDFNMAAFFHIGSFEWGYRAVNVFLGRLGLSYTSLFLSAAGVFYILLMRLLKRYGKMAWMALFLFVAMGGFVLTTSAMRQCLACGFLFLAYDALRQQKKLLFFLWVYIASTFHMSAVCFLLIYPLFYIRFREVFVLWGLALGLVLPFIAQPLLALFSYILPSYSWYADSYLFSTSSQYQQLNIGYFVLVLLKTSMFLLPSLLKKYTQPDAVVDNSIKWAALISILMLWASLQMRVFSRIEFYFMPFLFLYFSDFIATIRIQKFRRVCLLLVLAVVLFYRILIVINNPDTVWYYRFFWQ